MSNRGGVFPGQIKIDDVLWTDSIRVHFSHGYRMHFSDGNSTRPFGKSLCLLPVSKRMLLPEREEDMRSGRSFEFSGQRLGDFEDGPHGHAADGDFDNRPVTSFAMDTQFSPQELDVELEGETGPGIRICYFAKSFERGLDPWHFHIGFRIPRDAIKEFFELGSSHAEWVDQLLDRQEMPWTPFT